MKRIRFTTTLIAAGLSVVINQLVIAEEMNVVQSASAVDVAHQQALLNIQLNRASIIVGIIDRLRPEAQAQKLDDTWENELGDALESAEAEQLLSAERASGYGAVVSSITNTASKPELNHLSRVSGLSRALGSTSGDLVFTPVTLCRLVDTRLTDAGRIPAGDSRSFMVHGDLSSQGGSNCNNPDFDPSSVAISITSTAQVSRGFLTVYPHNTPLPLTSTVNYVPGLDFTNSTVVQSTIWMGNDISVFASSSSHVVIDLVGYFSPPLRTALDGITVEIDKIVHDRSVSTILSPSCPHRYTFSGAGHSWTGSADGVTFSKVAKQQHSNRAECEVRNWSGKPITVTCQATCLSIPGRRR